MYTYLCLRHNGHWLEGKMQFGKEGYIRDVLPQYSVCISNFKVISYSSLAIQSLIMFSTTNKEGKTSQYVFEPNYKTNVFGCLL